MQPPDVMVLSLALDATDGFVVSHHWRLMRPMMLTMLLLLALDAARLV
jgi:hypothetical protein